MYPANPRNLGKPTNFTVLGYRWENRIQSSRQRLNLFFKMLCCYFQNNLGDCVISPLFRSEL